MSVENWDADWQGSRDFQLGLGFTNVFEGTLSTNPSPTAPWRLRGDWTDVPRGMTQGHGTLSLLWVCRQVGRPQLRVESATGGFGTTLWTGPLYDGFPYLRQQADCDIPCRFERVGRGDDGDTLEGHLKLFKDYFTLYGYLGIDDNGYGAWVNWPAQDVAPRDAGGNSLDRSFGHFYCSGYSIFTGDPVSQDSWWASFDSPPDGDLNLYISVIPYFNNFVVRPLSLPAGAVPYAGLDWQLPEVGSGNWRSEQDDPDVPFLYSFHAEAVMYGSPRYINPNSCTPPDRVPLIPGWADAGANSVLTNGRPVNGATDAGMEIAGGPNCDLHHFTGETGKDIGWCLPRRIGSWRPSPGPLPPNPRPCPEWLNQQACPHGIVPGPVLLRITGALVRDCHGISCGGPWELHPVYSVDRINPSDASLQGVWAADDDGTYYVREFTDENGREQVWWLGLSQDQGHTFANVFHGMRSADDPAGVEAGTLNGAWVDVPLGAAPLSGTLSLSLLSPCPDMPFRALRVSVCALDMGLPRESPGTRFAKLYGGRLVSPPPTR
jgi:hypothetical protein